MERGKKDPGSGWSRASQKVGCDKEKKQNKTTGVSASVTSILNFNIHNVFSFQIRERHPSRFAKEHHSLL